MQVGLVTPPGVLREYVARAIEPAGHELSTAPSVEALLEQSGGDIDIVLFAPVIGDAPAAEVLADARERGLETGAVYLGLSSTDCEHARQSGFDRALSMPFQAHTLVATLEGSEAAGIHVLLADDSDLIHRHTTPILEAAGYRVSHAHDGQAALDAVLQDRPDLLLSDVEMPRLDGFELCRRIKENDDTASIPVVICSSLGEAADLERGFDAGADDYLVKPVVAEELMSRLHALLASRMMCVRERIVVVDDSAAVRHLVADCLQRQGFRVDTAVDGREGLAKIVASPPDLVLTDYDMPNMTGFELVVRLRRTESAKKVPIVMLTARETARDQAQMRAAGLTSYLVKPFGTDKCIALVERVLAEARLARYKDASRLYISEGAVAAAEDLSKGGEPFAIRANEVDATLLFSDISGFTSMSSRMSPAEVVAVLNSSFDALCVAIKEHGGDIDKFIGDAIMAVFEDRVDHDEPHTLRGVRAAWAMQRALDEFNADRDPPLMMRIGLNSGRIVRGDIGSRYVRRDYTCIGDAVNRAQRHESKAPLGGVLLSADLYARVADFVEVEEMTGLVLKGIEHPVSAYILKGFR